MINDLLKIWVSGFYNLLYFMFNCFHGDFVVSVQVLLSHLTQFRLLFFSNEYIYIDSDICFFLKSVGCVARQGPILLNKFVYMLTKKLLK